MNHKLFLFFVIKTEFALKGPFCMCKCSVAQSHLTPCNLIDCSLPGSSVHEISQARSGLPFAPPGDLLDRGIQHASTVSPALADRLFTTVPPGKPQGPPCHPLNPEMAKTMLSYKIFSY